MAVADTAITDTIIDISAFIGDITDIANITKVQLVKVPVQLI